ncbi:CPBP family intramembrane glutamic endopeptidase [Blastopirellula marina]|uniref:CAAX prenyl protease 2/Lysostaphin resistance protein A-like domain-containing protein n=1 Tax=Blastopirellula marina TaxID=124 RepID=A0A2S8FP40_9BACT|nr:CPBP family intramembrane glutamic endopeptidase [Blastopirellula marina]PQO33959.1 hypothetical protein C5Y98_17230 [Blastopirellula marina]PTL43745.1 CPBP family intramembrane metalloprotease [Blastopirellula marina]
MPKEFLIWDVSNVLAVWRQAAEIGQWQDLENRPCRGGVRISLALVPFPLLAQYIVFDDEDDYDYEDPYNGHETTARERAEGFIMTTVLFESALAFVAVGIGALIGVSPWISASWNSGAVLPVLMAIGWGILGTIPLLIAFLVMQYGSFRSLEDLQSYMERYLVPLFREATIYELGLISVAAGLGEEALFRGVIQTFLQQLVGVDASPVVPIAITSLLFGVVHFMSKEYFILASIMGAYFGVWFWWTGDIIIPIVIHTLYDWFALVYMRQTGEVADEKSGES